MRERSGPAAMALALDGAQIAAEVGFDPGLALAEEMIEEDILGRNRRVRLQLEDDVAVVMLQCEKLFCGIVRRLAGEF